MRELLVLVPKPGTDAERTIDAGSGIVCDPLHVISGVLVSDERIEVYYEGNRYGASNMQTFEDKVKHAAGRLSERYPTIAKAMLPRTQFAAVGMFQFTADWKETRLSITDEATVKRWTEGSV